MIFFFKILKFLTGNFGLAATVLIVCSIYAGGGFYMWNHYFRSHPDWAGQFGDMFGVVTSFFSAITVIIVFYAARLQKEELDETRKELKKQPATRIGGSNEQRQ